MQEQTISQERIKKITGRLKCAPPTPRFKRCRDNDAEYVCHECGAPLCQECKKEITDRRFYELTNARKRVAIAVTVLILLPVLTALISRYVAAVSLAGGVPSALILFLALVSPVELLRRTEPDETGKPVTEHKILLKEYMKAVHCRKCAGQSTTESWIATGITIVGILFAVLGVYVVIRGLIIGATSVNGALFLMSFGVAVLYTKKLLIELFLDFVPKLLRLS